MSFLDFFHIRFRWRGTWRRAAVSFSKAVQPARNVGRQEPPSTAKEVELQNWRRRQLERDSRVLLEYGCHALNAKVQDRREAAAELAVSRGGDSLVHAELKACVYIQWAHIMPCHVGESGDAYIAHRDPLGVTAYA